jgi:microcystin degradation protein MlrC
VGHRTQPHDPYDTAFRAAKLLFSLLNGAAKPTMAWHKIPLYTHQEQFLTSKPPMKSWFDRARAMEELPGVLSVSPFPIQPWLDVPEGGWTTVVVTDNNPALAEELSAELAELAWSMRDQFLVYESIDVATAVRQAVAAERGLVILSDTGDSVFGGATGDSTVILRELVHQQIPCTALVTVVDAQVARMAHNAGVGATLNVQLGGKLDTLFGRPLEVAAQVAALDEGMLESSVNYRSTFDMGKCALLQIGNIKVVVSENVGIGGNHPIVYRRFGVEPADAQIAVLKTASNFQYFADMTSQVIRVNTPGPTMSHLEQFNWQHIPRPTYPLDPITGWQPGAVPSL